MTTKTSLEKAREALKMLWLGDWSSISGAQTYQDFAKEALAALDEASAPRKPRELKCPKCGSDKVKDGFGLAGGGYGAYKYCEECAHLWDKTENPADYLDAKKEKK